MRNPLQIFNTNWLDNLFNVFTFTKYPQVAYIDVHATAYKHQVSASTSYKTAPLVSLSGDSGVVNISSNQATFESGKYEIEIPIGVHNGGADMDLLIYNITDTANLQEFLGVSYSVTTSIAWNTVKTTVILTSTKVLEFKTKAQIATGEEFISRIKITKLS